MGRVLGRVMGRIVGRLVDLANHGGCRLGGPYSFRAAFTSASGNR